MKQTEQPPEHVVGKKTGMRICRYLRDGCSPRTIRDLLYMNNDEPVPIKTIRAMKKEYEQGLNAKKFYKQKSSDIVQEFLDESRKGADVSEIHAALTHAMYTQLLNRHLEGEEAFADMPTKELFKLAADQQKVMGRNGRYKKTENGISPFNAIYLLDLMEESLENAPALKKAMAKRKPELIEKLKAYFDSDEFRAAREEYETLQEIREEYERTKNGDTARDEEHAGMAR